MSFVQRTTEGREQACKNLWEECSRHRELQAAVRRPAGWLGGAGQVTEGETGGWGKRARQGANIPPEPGLHSK